MRIAEENWEVLSSLFPAGWQQMAWQSGAVERLRGFPSPDVLLRTLMRHVARGYSLRETVVRAKLANWADISDVALLKRLRNSEESGLDISSKMLSIARKKVPRAKLFRQNMIDFQIDDRF